MFMQIITDPAAFSELCWKWRCEGKRTALVPTMGYFHEGHLSLMQYAREHADKVMVSLFVNPTQFGPNEDLDAYPRDAERDAMLAEQQGVDVLFIPEPDAMYDAEAATWVEVPSLATSLCGTSRPIHFRGVCTVVTKLFMLAMPTMAVFGEKDRQQLTIIRRMARDLNFPVEIVGRPTFREPDGLAMSSRNAYLSEAERSRAPLVQEGLARLQQWVQETKDVAELVKRLESYYGKHLPSSRVDYVEIVDASTMQPIQRIKRDAVAAVAVFFGKTRLIDNVLIET